MVGETTALTKVPNTQSWSGDNGQAHDGSVVDYNAPPYGQPSLWCDWVPNEDGTEIRQNGREKFYCYVEWLNYLIEHFLKPWGYKLSGRVTWVGELEDEDQGVIDVDENSVASYEINLRQQRENEQYMLATSYPTRGLLCCGPPYSPMTKEKL